MESGLWMHSALLASRSCAARPPTHALQNCPDRGNRSAARFLGQEGVWARLAVSAWRCEPRRQTVCPLGRHVIGRAEELASAEATSADAGLPASSLPVFIIGPKSDDARKVPRGGSSRRGQSGVDTGRTRYFQICSCPWRVGIIRSFGVH